MAVKDLLTRRRALLLGGLPLLAAIMVVLAVVLGSGGGSPAGESRGRSAGLAGAQPEVEATIDLSRATILATAGPSVARPGSPGDKLVIPRFGVEAPLTYRLIGLDGVMLDPAGPDDVAVYDFANWPGYGGLPGGGGNTVISGHVDYGIGACKNGKVPPPCQAVFWDIRRLQTGDEVQVVVAGVTYTYRVTGNQTVPETSDSWSKILASTAQETITLITCAGDFNRATRQYSSRQVVTAARS